MALNHSCNCISAERMGFHTKLSSRPAKSRTWSSQSIKEKQHLTFPAGDKKSDCVVKVYSAEIRPAEAVSCRHHCIHQTAPPLSHMIKLQLRQPQQGSRCHQECALTVPSLLLPVMSRSITCDAALRRLHLSPTLQLSARTQSSSFAFRVCGRMQMTVQKK